MFQLNFAPLNDPPPSSLTGFLSHNMKLGGCCAKKGRPTKGPHLWECIQQQRGEKRSCFYAELVKIGKIVKELV